METKIKLIFNGVFFIITTTIALLLLCCNPDNPDPVYPDVDREGKIPKDIVKGDTNNDNHPPILHVNDFIKPVPLPYPINTAGAEDSPFITPDGNTLYFFFTPDVRITPDKQLLDSVTGVWVSNKKAGIWGKPVRLWLQDPGKLALDGAVCVQGNEMWFASAREGYQGVNMFTAEYSGDRWKNWKYCGDRLMKEIQIGEVHIHGDDLYFHSSRNGGKGNYDLWVTTRNGSAWSDPVNLEKLNSAEMDGYPYVSQDGKELWFTRTYLGTPAIYRSLKDSSGWSDPVLIVSQFAGEPTLDLDGNLYFVHHYFKNNVMIEADIYFAAKK
ncbi:MAG TPA: hypothetical protein P5050_07650 [Bacteroidia bacterium]|nr:hypothetical protein [Sphingobacteriales bacterium]HPD65583.1 hypothetical protein [Bacteroidia bacterium]HRS59077.1 hypothetical protein [Bacteroidia bacterium]